MRTNEQKHRQHYKRVASILVCLLGIILPGHAQSALPQSTENPATYKEKLAAVLKAFGDKEQFNSLTESAQTLILTKISTSDNAAFKTMSENEKAQKAKELADKYAKEQFFTDISDIMLEQTQIQTSVPEEQLDQLVRLLQDEKTQTAIAHLNQATADTSSVKTMDWEAILAESEKAGKLPAPIQAKECTESYKTAFDRYYEKSGQHEAIEKLLGMLEAMMALSDGNDGNTKQMKAALDYMKANVKTAILNSYIGTVTEEDLNILYEMQNTSAGEAITRTLVDPETLTSIMTGIIGKILPWIDRQLSAQPK